jgi:hypothetical protein
MIAVDTLGADFRMTPDGDNGRRSLNRREFLAGASALAVGVGIGADPGRAGALPTVS